MGKTKFTTWVDSEALQTAKQYATQHGTTLASLVDAFFRSLEKVHEIQLETPILKELAGSLSEDASLEKRHVRLEKK